MTIHRTDARGGVAARDRVRNFLGTLAGLAAGFSVPALAANGSKYNLQPPATAIAREVYDLHTTMMWICVVIFVVVFGVMFYSVFKHRKSLGHKAEQFHENTTVEVLWTIVPIIILVAMAFPATKVLLNQKDTANPDITIKATGYQWKWGYDYLKGDGEGISFMSSLSTPPAQLVGTEPKNEQYLLQVDNPVVVPVNKKIRVLTTANDVIHSWWIPAFGAKQDAIPGFVRDTWFRAEREGTYRGQCVELCGKDHGFMPIVVEVVSESKYKDWVDDQKKKIAAAADDPNKTWDVAGLVDRGAKVYAANCVACHQATGMGLPPAFPALSGSKIVTGPKDGQINVVLNGIVKDGKPTAMAAFKGQLSDTDIAAVITYTRNSWANKTGEAIQPSEVKAQRK